MHVGGPCHHETASCDKVMVTREENISMQTNSRVISCVIEMAPDSTRFQPSKAENVLRWRTPNLHGSFPCEMVNVDSQLDRI